MDDVPDGKPPGAGDAGLARGAADPPGHLGDGAAELEELGPRAAVDGACRGGAGRWWKGSAGRGGGC